MALQTTEESKFYPLSDAVGRSMMWDRVRLSYSFFSSLGHAHTSRLFLFRTSGQGYRNSKSLTHNLARFKSKKTLLPNRERTHIRNAEIKKKQEARRKAIIGLKYGRRYGTTTMQTVNTALENGIRIRPQQGIQPIEEAERELEECLEREDREREGNLPLSLNPQNKGNTPLCSGNTYEEDAHPNCSSMTDKKS